MSADLEQLRATFPDWEIEVRWTVAGARPDASYLQARKNEVTLTAWSANNLAAKIVAEVLAAALRDQS